MWCRRGARTHAAGCALHPPPPTRPVPTSHPRARGFLASMVWRTLAALGEGGAALSAVSTLPAGRVEMWGWLGGAAMRRAAAWDGLTSGRGQGGRGGWGWAWGSDPPPALLRPTPKKRDGSQGKELLHRCLPGGIVCGRRRGGLAAHGRTAPSCTLARASSRAAMHGVPTRSPPPRRLQFPDIDRPGPRRVGRWRGACLAGGGLRARGAGGQEGRVR